jgi:hypothetical protein
MDHSFDLDRVPEVMTPLSSYEAVGSESLDDNGLANVGAYQEIAERRAMLECAETLRRVRAL